MHENSVVSQISERLDDSPAGAHHLLAVFVGAFASQVAIAANTSFNIATWKAALMAAFFSGIVAVAHVVIG